MYCLQTKLNNWTVIVLAMCTAAYSGQILAIFRQPILGGSKTLITN